MKSLLPARALRWGGLVLLAGALATTSAWASRAAAQAAPAKDAAAEEEPLPQEEDVELDTRDGVTLRATFYPGTKGKESVPVVALHAYKGSRKDYAALALFLQRQGHAVLVPDLRGHGDSTRMRGMNTRLEAKSLPPEAFAAMVTADMEACKQFLMAKNNAGELNIEKLCLVGAEMGSVVAIDFARLDWSWPLLVDLKQGQDVKALVLISPRWSFRNLQIRPALDQPAFLSRISTMIIVGQQDSRARSEAKRLYSMLTRLHPTADAEKIAQRTLIYSPLPTSLQGTKMFDAPELQLPERIKRFLDWRLVDQTFPWTKRQRMPLRP